MSARHSVTKSDACRNVAVAERAYERVLNGVRRTLAVPERTQRRGPEPVAVPADQFSERCRVASNMPGKQFTVAARRRRQIAREGVTVFFLYTSARPSSPGSAATGPQGATAGAIWSSS